MFHPEIALIPQSSPKRKNGVSIQGHDQPLKKNLSANFWLDDRKNEKRCQGARFQDEPTGFFPLPLDISSDFRKGSHIETRIDG